jgi:hypothetical protein
MPRSDQPESSRVRFAREGWVTDINVPALERAARGEARDGHALEVGVRLWDRVGAGALLAQGTRALPAETVRLVRNAVRVRPVRAAPDIRGHIEALRREAQSSLGPDTTVLDAVLATWEDVLERYATGWRRYVPALESQFVTGLLDESGVPLGAIHESLLELTLASVQTREQEALFNLAYYPIRILRRAIEWRAPAYFSLLDLYPAFYRALAVADGQLFRQRIADRPWVHLVEALEFVLPLSRPPYAPDSDDTILDAARTALRRSLAEVLRAAIRHRDIATLREALRRWRMAEEDVASGEPPPPHVRFAIPLAWEIVRLARSADLTDPGPMFWACVDGIEIDVMVDALRAQLDEDQRFIDLDRWVRLDLPSHEVHFIDSHADLFRAFAIAAAGRLDLAAPPTLIKMDRRLYDLREQFEQEVGKLKAEAETIGARFGVQDLHDRLDVLLRAWKEGVNRYERDERDQIRWVARAGSTSQRGD